MASKTSITEQMVKQGIAQAINKVLSENAQHIAVPKRFTLGARDIWHIQR